MGDVLHVAAGDWESLGRDLEDLSGLRLPDTDPRRVLMRAAPGAVSVDAAQNATDRYEEHFLALRARLRRYSETALECAGMFAKADADASDRMSGLDRQGRASGQCGGHADGSDDVVV